ncbi:MAG TPA: hypothetical protein VMM27_08315 [Casimicrobiaceae bacterium]|nr:hypothetical protein [Casimicrobiaceae bacterium]
MDADYINDLRRYLPSNWGEGCAFVDRKGHRRLEIHPDGNARVLANYAWDGCTPKFSLFDIGFGTPDGIPNQITRKPKAYSIYYAAVRVFGGAFRRFTRWKRSYAGKRIAL